MSNTNVIRRFFDAWEAKSLDGILDLMTPDARWLNVGAPESVGRDAIRMAIAPFRGIVVMPAFTAVSAAQVNNTL